MSRLLPENKFIRAYRNYIVPISGIEAIQQKSTIKNIQLSIGDRYADAIKL